MLNSVLFSVNSIHNENPIDNSIHHGCCMKEFVSTWTTSRKETKPWRNYIFYGLERKIWHVKNPYFYCKGDNFNLKPSVEVSVGTNLSILSNFISEWGTLLKVQIMICLCACAEMISLQIHWKLFYCDNSRSKQLRLLVFIDFAVIHLAYH